MKNIKKLYRHLEISFEKLTSIANLILGNPITFILAFFTVIYWLCSKEFAQYSVHDKIGDLILGLTFLTLFVIQKSFNRFSASLHLKVNELIASHADANNKFISIEERTEHETAELSKEYEELIELAKEEKSD